MFYRCYILPCLINGVVIEFVGLDKQIEKAIDYGSIVVSVAASI